MNQIIIVRYSELVTKGKNRMEFIRTLSKNLNFNLSKFPKIEIKIKKDFDKIMITFHKKDLDIIKECLNNLIGISSYTFVNTYTNWEDFEKGLIKFVSTIKGTFKIIPKIRQKGIAVSSDTFKRDIAKIILENTTLKVDVKTPDNPIVVEAFVDLILLHTNNNKVPEGLPVGTNGNALSLISGGIDSPVASYLTMKRGMSINYITFLTPPHTTEKAETKIISIVKELSKFSNKNPNLYIVNYSPILNELSHIKDERYKIVLMRRSFLRMAGKLIKEINIDCLVTGDSLGQVASQTINGLKVSTEATDELILRPLITMSKNETINISKKIKTYELSISDGEDTCSMFVPKNPVTKPKLGVAKKLENDLMILYDLEDKILKENIKIIKINGE